MKLFYHLLLFSFCCIILPVKGHTNPPVAIKNQKTELAETKKKKGNFFSRLLQKKLEKKLRKVKEKREKGKRLEPLSKLSLLSLVGGFLLSILVSSLGLLVITTIIGAILAVGGLVNFLLKPGEFKGGSIVIIVLALLAVTFMVLGALIWVIV